MNGRDVSWTTMRDNIEPMLMKVENEIGDTPNLADTSGILVGFIQ